MQLLLLRVQTLQGWKWVAWKVRTRSPPSVGPNERSSFIYRLRL